MTHRFLSSRVLMAAALFTGLTAAIAHADLIGATFDDGTLYTINPATGAATTPRNTGLTLLTGITTRPSDGAIFGLTNAGSLYRINPANGVSTLVGPTGFSYIEGDIAYDAASGFLYGIQEFSTGAYRTTRIDPATGASTVVGTATGVSDLSAGAFAPNGTFYVIDTGSGSSSNLYTFSKLTGQVLTTTPLNVALPSTAGLAFDPQTGTAYVVSGTATGTNTLYTLSLATGTLTTVGTNTNQRMSGLTFTAIPEPTTAAFATIGLGLMAMRRRRGL